MGYSTSYNLKVKIGDSDLVRKFVEENEEASYALDSYGDTEESCKWYDHEEEIKSFSSKHPDTLFELRGNGEESGDIWIKYFQGGKCQKCGVKLVFEEFDQTKLK